MIFDIGNAAPELSEVQTGFFSRLTENGGVGVPAPKLWHAILCEIVRALPRLGCPSPELESTDDLLRLLVERVPMGMPPRIAYTGVRLHDLETIADRVADLAFVLAVTEDVDASFVLSGHVGMTLNRMIAAERLPVH